MTRATPYFLVATLALSACHEKPSPLTPDLRIEFRCARPPSPNVVTSFMAAHGFYAADVETPRRAKGKKFFPIQVEGFNEKSMVIEMIGLKEPPSLGHAINYRLSILSRPPTNRDPELESDARTFVQTQLGCSVLSAETGNNDDASSGQFAHYFDVVKKRVEEARNDSAN